ncbi:conserved protein of unknown function [Methylocella tundrae]|uniref:DUF302 domain-containing protein n=2 Tax=Methylocella tundrae TaxID=227605 RepID=A0A4U8Z3T7_METTU|nr:conserved protein of unknown function [Methylocella tundrae]
MLNEGQTSRPAGLRTRSRQPAADRVKAAPGKRPPKRPPKASRMIALASVCLVTLTGIEAALAAPVVTERVIEVEHVKIETTKTFEQVEAALDGALPPIDPAIAAALTNGDSGLAKKLEHGAELFIFLKRDHGAFLRSAGRSRKALQYEIGNPLTATMMTQHELPAALYAPLRVVLYENAAGGATFEYDKPSTLFGQFGDERVAAVSRDLDAELERALRRAAE